MSSNLGNKQTMAKNIRYYMELHDKTRNDICKDLGFKYTTFTDWINAVTYPRIDKIEMMAEYFGVSKADLVEERGTVSKTEESESQLLNLYRKLNAENQEKALRILSGMVYAQEGDEIIMNTKDRPDV